MRILAIESSCDETAAAVIEDGTKVLSNIINTQIELHKLYGGVVPEIASRKHIENVSVVVDKALEESGFTLSEMDAVAVTYGPGLVGALLVGVSTAKGLAFAGKKPLIPVHHIKGHICANYIENPEFKPPFLCLVASGGHSHLVLAEDYDTYRVLARTRDDAAGEAFDKVSRVLGLGYPGGPAIQKAAERGDSNAIHFPRVNMGESGLDFSFSGVKTAVLNYLHNAEQKGEEINAADVAASFQEAVVDVLSEHLIACAKKCGVKQIALAGGVAANLPLRARIEKRAKEEGFFFQYPRLSLCTDNAAMIGCAAYYAYQNGKIADMSLNAVPNLSLEE
ncbi:MAG: tRNA (adenosine(37)-N6)-threonylcarbamoyltransferase complex transferase subunit TsaD [Clostridia bacterium]|nr:tRNA (adenosine(37)-N6)-threonylcarbamoyltransferase complex transferase subunit TsaD [Clostridia bacterium]